MINTQNNFKVNNWMPVKSVSQQDDIKKAQREILEKHYQKKFDTDMKDFKMWNIISLALTAISGIIFFASKKGNRSEAASLAIAGLATILVLPFVKPKKEKYEAKVEKELNEVV